MSTDLRNSLAPADAAAGPVDTLGNAVDLTLGPVVNLIVPPALTAELDSITTPVVSLFDIVTAPVLTTIQRLTGPTVSTAPVLQQPVDPPPPAQPPAMEFPYVQPPSTPVVSEPATLPATSATVPASELAPSPVLLAGAPATFGGAQVRPPDGHPADQMRPTGPSQPSLAVPLRPSSVLPSELSAAITHALETTHDSSTDVGSPTSSADRTTPGTPLTAITPDGSAAAHAVEGGGGSAGFGPAASGGGIVNIPPTMPSAMRIMAAWSLPLRSLGQPPVTPD